MRVTRFSPAPEYHYPAFDRSVADPAARARCMTPSARYRPRPTSAFTGPSFGLRYRVSFNEAARVTLSVVLEGDGCDEVLFSETDRRTPDDAFSHLLADTLGVKKEEIFDVLPNEVRR